MKRILIAQAIPREFVEMFKVSQAGNNFCHRLISYNFFNEVFSISPVNISTKIEITDAPYSFIQCRALPHLGPLRVVNVILENIELFWQINKKGRCHYNVWFYNLTISNFVLFIFLKLLKWNVFVIVADYEPKMFFFSFDRVLHQLLHLADGIVALSSNVKKVFFKNTTVLNGLIDDGLKTDEVSQGNSEGQRCFLYAGALEEYCGIDLALEVFKDCPHAQLVITGRGSYEAKVIEFARRYPNIRYFGFMPYHQYLLFVKTVDFCLSLRNPAIPFNAYNFPSKIIEFCQMGKVVISTMAYGDFPESIVLSSRFHRDSLLTTIGCCLMMSEDEIRLKKLNARRQVLMKYGPGNWMRTILTTEENAKDSTK